MITALQAFQEMGIAPAQALDHLWLWKASASDQTVATSVLVIGRDPLAADAVQALNTAAQAQNMEPLFAPGDHETLFSPLRSGDTLTDYIDSDASYNLSPTTDDQPYFFNLDFGIPPAVQSALTVAALLALGLLAVAWFTEDESARFADKWRLRAAVGYAALIGAGFMLIEVPLIQRFQLLLGQPILSLAAVLATLLLSGGVGSLVSQRLPADTLPMRVRMVGAVILGLALIYWLALPPLLESLLRADYVDRLLAIIVLTALIGFPMGMPFPSLMRLADHGRQQVALLWAVNGAFSVLGSTLAMVLSMLWGFKWALLLGAVLYLGLALLAPRLKTSRAS